MKPPSLTHVFKSGPRAWDVANIYENSTDLYLEDSRWEDLDSLVEPIPNIPLVMARIANGQVLGLAYGGYYAPTPP